MTNFQTYFESLVLKSKTKKIISTLVTVVLCVIAFGAFRTCNKVENNDVLINSLNRYIDSLENVVNQVPDTVFFETIVYRDTIIEKITYFLPPVDSVEEHYNIYQDSIITNEINVWATIQAKELYSISIKYKPITLVQTQIIREPYPVRVIKELPVPQKGFYGTIGVGTGFSAEVFYLNKKERLFGVELIYLKSPAEIEYARFPAVMFKIGKKF